MNQELSFEQQFEDKFQQMDLLKLLIVEDLSFYPDALVVQNAIVEANDDKLFNQLNDLFLHGPYATFFGKEIYELLEVYLPSRFTQEKLLHVIISTIEIIISDEIRGL